MNNLKTLNWKTLITAPEDASRPKCTVAYSYDGNTIDHFENENTDLVDWLLVIKYQTYEKK